MKYRVVLRHSEQGCSVSVTGLPGCWSQGATENIREAIQEYLAARVDLPHDADVREMDIAE